MGSPDVLSLAAMDNPHDEKGTAAMTGTNQSNDVRRLAGFCALAMALIFLSNPFTRLLVPGGDTLPVSMAAVGFMAVLNLGLMVGALLGVTQLLRPFADRTGITGGALAMIGWTASARIMLLAQVDFVLRGEGSAATNAAITSVFETSPLVFISLIAIGLCFPIGLMILGVALFRAPQVTRWTGALVFTGGVLFPIGRAAGIGAAVLATDVVLMAAFACVGWELLRPSPLAGALPQSRAITTAT